RRIDRNVTSRKQRLRVLDEESPRALGDELDLWRALQQRVHAVEQPCFADALVDAGRLAQLRTPRELDVRKKSGEQAEVARLGAVVEYDHSPADRAGDTGPTGDG